MKNDIHDDIEITEVLSIQGRMKRRFAARRNRQKLKVARMRAARRASDPRIETPCYPWCEKHDQGKDCSG